MLITLDMLEAMIPYATDEKRLKYLTPLNTAMQRYGIITPIRIAAFIAQITYESGSLHYVEEIASGSAYEYREDLGNLTKEALKAAHSHGTTTGKFYVGHGLLQITGYYNHKICGEALGIDLVNQPRLLCSPIYAAASAAWYWDTHNCNSLADVDLFDKITKVINGGYNGLSERKKNYALCRQVLRC